MWNHTSKLDAKFRGPARSEEGRAGPSSSLQDLKAQRSYVTCSRPLSIASGKSAARIQGVKVLVPLNTC